MKHYLFLLCWFTGIDAWCQQMTIAPGTHLINQNATVTLLNNSLKNDGVVSGTNGLFVFGGASDNAISGSGITDFHNINLEKTNGAKLFLQKSISASGVVLFNGGLLDLGNQQMELVHPNGLLQNESEASRVTATGTGEIYIKLNINAPSHLNPGNLGAFLSGTDNLGLTTVRRGHAVQLTNNQQQSIRRYFSILPANNDGIYQRLQFTYFDAELNGVAEADLDLFEKEEGSEWTKLVINGTSTSLNFKEVFGLTSLKRYTLFAAAPVPPVPGTITLTAPQNKTITGCYTQAQVDAAFLNWLNEVKSTASCNVAITNNSTGAPPACGGTAFVIFTATADCAPSTVASASFTVAAPSLQLNCPSNVTVPSGATPEYVATAFSNWLKSATVIGCNATVQHNSNGIAPACGSSVNVTFTATNSCGQSTSCSASFSVPACSTQQGCTPGYWKNHPKLWSCGYTSKTKFFDVFTSIVNKNGLSDKTTLEDALGMNGGGFDALARHAVAALLNACHHAVDYPYTADEVKAAVVNMFNSGVALVGSHECKGVEVLKNVLDAANNLGCPLNNNFKNGLMVNGKTSETELAPEELNESLKVTAYPNPFKEVVRFTVTANESGQAKLEIMNAVGQKVGVAYAGSIHAGKSLGIEYKVPAGASGTFFYLFTLNGKQVSGKLVRIN